MAPQLVFSGVLGGLVRYKHNILYKTYAKEGTMNNSIHKTLVSLIKRNPNIFELGK